MMIILIFVIKKNEIYLRSNHNNKVIKGRQVLKNYFLNIADNRIHSHHIQINCHRE